MGIDLATWRARIGLNCYHMCRPLQTRWRSSGGQLYQPRVASWGVGEVMNDTPLVLKGCMTVVALSLILQYVVHSSSQLKGRGGGGKVCCCHWRESTSQVRVMVDGGGTLLLRTIVVVIPLLLVIAGDVETNPGPEVPSLRDLMNKLHSVRASWYNIGLELRIPQTTLDYFKKNCFDQQEMMKRMLAEYCTTPALHPLTWKAVISALRSPSVDERKLAAKLESKYCTPAQHMIERPYSPTEVEKSDEPSLGALLNALHSVSASWYNIGLELGIPHSVLDQFKQNHSEQSDLMREMLKEWLKTSDEPPPTWEAVVRALKSPSVKEISIAARLESKYCIPVQLPTLKALLNALHPVRASSYNIGLELDIPHTDLDCLMKDYSDESDFLREVLALWLRIAYPTWEAVVKALKSPIVNEEIVAEQVESKYCTPVQYRMDESSSPVKVEEGEEPTVETLFRELHPVCASWYNIGIQLDINPCHLNTIRINHYGNPSESMLAMVIFWLNNFIDPPTWKAVVTALRSPPVNRMDVAAQLESKYCVLVQHTVDDHHLSICEQVMREYGKMDQTITHCIFVGPPGVGKSSLMNRLLHLKLDPSRTSTQVAEKSVMIRNVSTTAAQVSGIDWQKIEDPISQASELMGQLSAKQELVSKVEVSKEMEKSLTQSSRLREETSQVPNQGVINISQSITPTISDSHKSQFSKTMDFFQRVVKEKGVSSLQQQISGWTVYLTDSGGQPEFQELLPALVVGPCVFFVVFPLDKDPEENYEVEYVRPDEQKCMRKYLSSLTLQEDLMRSLASIACLTYKDNDGNILRPKVMLVATFRDKVPQEEDCKAKLDYINMLVKETDAFHLDMIVEASETQIVFTINNASDVQSKKDAQEMRDAFQILADGFKVHLPSPWLIFSIRVQHDYAQDSIISKKKCFEVAQECGISNEIEFEAALQFLHKQTGVLHYYKKPPELSQIVIRDPQHLLSRVNLLVEKTFTFVKTRSTRCTENFKRGIFKQTDYERLTKEFGQSNLNPSMLLKLLEHLNVVVPLDGERYFMPCAIAHLDEDPVTGHTRSSTIPPLLITFKSGYCPKGLFGALVACITNKKVANCVLNLDESKVYRDQICFKMDKHSLLLRVNPTYIYIEVIPYNPDTPLSTLCTICNDVHKLILENIKIACKTLHYSDNANCCLSFKCPCDQYDQQEKFHPAMLREDLNNRFWCIQSKRVVDVRRQCYIWLPEPTILQHPDCQSVAPGTEAVFQVRATGYHLQFQWQKDLSDFCDGGRCRGTSTDTLRILEVKKGDKGRYRCLVKNEVEEMYSDEALLTVSDDSVAPPSMKRKRDKTVPPFKRRKHDTGHTNASDDTVAPHSKKRKHDRTAPPSKRQKYDTADTTASTCNIQLKTLLRELTSVSGSQWLNLGIQLDIEDSTLEDIEANHRGDVHRCKTEMLRAWLQSDPTNPWTKLATALKHMKYKVLAQRILEKYNTVMPKSDSES